MIRIIIVCIGLLVAACCSVNAQIAGPCDTVRWIKMNNVSTKVFLDSFTNFIPSLKKLTEENQSIFFLESHDISDKVKLYPSLLLNIEKDSLNWHECTTSFDGKDSSFVIGYNNELPFCNQSGNVIEFYDLDYGYIEYCYPPLTYTEIVETEITEIRIRERLVWNENLNASSYEPEAIMIYPTYGYWGSELWIDLIKVQKFKSSNAPKWVEFFILKKYNGFQYMQTNCAK